MAGSVPSSLFCPRGWSGPYKGIQAHLPLPSTPPSLLQMAYQVVEKNAALGTLQSELEERQGR